MTILVFNIFYKDIHLKRDNTVEKLNVLWYNIVKLMKKKKVVKRKIFLIMICTTLLLLSGCTGEVQEDYDALIATNTSLESENAKLESEMHKVRKRKHTVREREKEFNTK